MNEQLLQILDAIEASEIQPANPLALAKFSTETAKHIGKAICDASSWQNGESWESSEMGLFLAELSAENNDPDFRDGAFSATEFAIDQLGNPFSTADLTEFATSVGVAFYAVKVGAMLESADLVSRGATILENLEMPAELADEEELVPGKAGAILLVLARRGGPGMPKWHNITSK